MVARPSARGTNVVPSSCLTMRRAVDPAGAEAAAAQCRACASAAHTLTRSPPGRGAYKTFRLPVFLASESLRHFLRNCNAIQVLTRRPDYSSNDRPCRVLVQGKQFK